MAAGIAAVLGIWFVATLAKRQRGRFMGGMLGHYLMDDIHDPLTDGLPSSKSPVWLAPDIPPAQFGPSFEAAEAAEQARPVNNNQIVDYHPKQLWLAPVLFGTGGNTPTSGKVWLAPVL